MIELLEKTNTFNDPKCHEDLVKTNCRCDYSQKYEEVINKYPNFLTKDEERELLAVLKRYNNGNKRDKAQEELINYNYRLILKQVSNHRTSTHLPLEDLFSAGLQGFVTAINNYDVTYNTRLSTFAVLWINLYILRLITSFNTAVYVPSHILLKKNQYRKMLDKIAEDNNITISDTDLMEELDVSKRMLSAIKASHSNSIISLDGEVVGTNGETRPLSEVIADVNAKSALTICQEKDAKKYLKQMVLKLDPISRDIITRRYLMMDKEGLFKVAKIHNITGERVRQIEVKALKLLKKRLKNRSAFNIK